MTATTLIIFLSLASLTIAESHFGTHGSLSAYANKSPFGAKIQPQQQQQAYRIQPQQQFASATKAIIPNQQIQYGITAIQPQRQQIFSNISPAYGQIIPQQQQQFAIAQQQPYQPYQPTQQRYFSSYFLRGDDVARKGQIGQIGADYGISPIKGISQQTYGAQQYSAIAQPLQYSSASGIAYQQPQQYQYASQAQQQPHATFNINPTDIDGQYYNIQ